MHLFVIHDSKVNKCEFWLLPGQNKTFEDVSLGCWKSQQAFFTIFYFFMNNKNLQIT